MCRIATHAARFSRGRVIVGIGGSGVLGILKCN